jgi:transcriptional/translational regulatory protein YebC/TACO1
LGKTGSLDFIFTRKSVFTFDPGDRDLEELEFELIDAGLEDFFVEADEEGNDIAVITYRF